jgi:hypothetical protein
MTDQLKSVREDIAFLKDLAADGGQVPSVAGAQLFAAGLIFGLSLIATWAGMKGLIPLSRAWQNTSGLWSTALYLPVMALIFWVYRHAPKASSGGRAMASAWGTIGLSSVTIVIALVVVGLKLKNPMFIAYAWPPVAFALYGAAWLTFTIARNRPRWVVVSLGSYAMAIVIAATTRSTEEWLTFAIGLLAFMAAPGFLMMRPGRPAA